MKKTLTIALAATMLFVLTAGAPAQAHTRTASTELSINVSDSTPDRGKKVTFTGRLKSEWSKCEAFRKVTLKRGKTPIETKLTNREGRYTFIQRINANSNWKVRFTGKRFGVHPHVHRCLPDTSRVIRIRVNDDD